MTSPKELLEYIPIPIFLILIALMLQGLEKLREKYRQKKQNKNVQWYQDPQRLYQQNQITRQKYYINQNKKIKNSRMPSTRKKPRPTAETKDKYADFIQAQWDEMNKY